jgi:cell division ATPase FtsA
MIVEYDDDGRISHIIHDPVHESIVGTLHEMGRQFLDLATIPWPPQPVIDKATGEPMIDEDSGAIIVASQGYDSPSVDGESQYVLDGAIEPRPTFKAPELVEIVADDVDEKVIENLPENATLLVDGEMHQLDGTTLTIASDMPAEYEIRIQKFPFIERTVKVIAHAA